MAPKESRRKMNQQTLPVGATTRRETATLKATYDEALAIKEAWDHRVAVAESKLMGAMASGYEVDAARRNVAAVALQHAEAVAQMGMALDAWLDAVDTARHRAAVLAVGLQSGRGRVIGHPRHS